MFLARSITRSKWEAKNGLQPGEIPADAITGDLRTKENSLSFWLCEPNDQEELNDVALAISATRDSVAKIELVWLEREELEASGQFFDETPGQTPVLDLVDRHLDLRRLDGERLGRLALHVQNAISMDRYKRMSRRQVRDILGAAVLEGRVRLENLSQKIQIELQR